MRFEWRPLRAGEPDHELIWLCVTVAAAALLADWTLAGLSLPRCTFRAVTGLPCLTCGATRAALSLLHGEMASAWRFNPLATLAMGGVGVFDVYAAAVLTFGAKRIRMSFPSRRAWAITLGGGTALALANWVYLLRNGG